MIFWCVCTQQSKRKTTTTTIDSDLFSLTDELIHSFTIIIIIWSAWTWTTTTTMWFVNWIHTQQPTKDNAGKKTTTKIEFQQIFFSSFKIRNLKIFFDNNNNEKCKLIQIISSHFSILCVGVCICHIYFNKLVGFGYLSYTTYILIATYSAYHQSINNLTRFGYLLLFTIINNHHHSLFFFIITQVSHMIFFFFFC